MNGLARPARPALPVLVYDGDCGFCTSSARWAERRLRIAIAPWQALDLDQVGLTEAACDQAVQWVAADGQVSAGAAAVAAALRARGGVFGGLGWAMQLPLVGCVAGATYRLVARNRYRLPGSTDACRL